MEFQKPFAFDLGWQSVALVAVVIWYFSHRVHPVYLVDFTTFKPPQDWKVTPDDTLELMQKTGSFTEESLQFMERMLKQSGVGPQTAWPPGMMKCLKNDEKPDESVDASRKEAEVCLIYSVLHLLID